MIDDDTIRAVQRLLAGGCPIKQIVAQLDISRPTIRRIQRGERKVGQRSNHEREGYNNIEPRGSKNRCPTCGGMVYGECLACRVRKTMEGEKKPN